MVDIWSLTENPSFMFIFHEIVCILGCLYYLPPMLTRLREKKEGKEFSTSWKDLKNIVATYIVVAESIFLYDEIKKAQISNVPTAIVTQTLAIVVIAAAYIILKEEPPKNSFKSVANTKKRIR